MNITPYTNSTDRKKETKGLKPFAFEDQLRSIIIYVL